MIKLSDSTPAGREREQRANSAAWTIWTPSVEGRYPLFHVAGVLPGSLTSFSAGSEVVIPSTSLFRNREVINNYWRLVERHGATAVSAVPTVLTALVNIPVGNANITSLRYCRTGAAPLSPDLAARFQTLFGLHVHESLGMTEMAGISTITPPGVSAPAGCVDFRLPHTQLRVVALDQQGNPTERDLPRGQQGMVIFKSPTCFPALLTLRTMLTHSQRMAGWPLVAWVGSTIKVDSI